MHKVNQYISIIKQFYYLDQNAQLRYKNNGYLGRYKKDDLVHTHKDSHGYLQVHIPLIRNKTNGSICVRLAHVIWVLSGNIYPDNMQLDHIDGNVQNNSLSNLRLVSCSTNSKNRKKRSDNTSGITGICWNKAHKAWCVRRTVHGIRKCRYCKTIEQAKKTLEEFTALDKNYTSRHGK